MPIPLHSGFDAKWTLYYALLRVGDAQSIAAAARSLAATDPQSAAEMSPLGIGSGVPSSLASPQTAP